MVLGFRSFGTPRRLLVRGRALQDEGIRPAGDKDSVWRNLVNSYKRMEADPLPHARVRASIGGSSVELGADDEGFFHGWLELDTPLHPEGDWATVSLELLSPLSGDGERIVGEARVLVPPPSTRFLVISDMDDTVLQSHITSVAQAVRTVLLGNARTRLPFPGVAAFYEALHQGLNGERNPVFYVSSSPWNLYDLLVDFLAHQGIPEGPITLRDWDLERSALGNSRLHGFKDVAIREILDLFPTLPVILIGDTTQRDPEIYSSVVHEYPERVLAVYVRDVKKTPARRAAVGELAKAVQEAKSVLVLADDTMAAAEHAAEQGWIDAKSLPAIRGEKRMDEGATPGKTGPPAKKASDGTDAATVVDGGAGTVEVKPGREA